MKNPDSEVVERLIIGAFALQVKTKKTGIFVQLKYGRFLILELKVASRIQVDLGDGATDIVPCKPEDSNQYREALRRALDWTWDGWLPSKATKANADFLTQKLEQAELPGTTTEPQLIDLHVVPDNEPQ